MARYFKLAKESSYGELPANPSWVGARILSESLRLEKGLVYHRTIEGGRLLQTKQLGKSRVTGSIDMLLVYDKALGEFLHMLFGEVTSTQATPPDGLAYRHVFTPKLSIRDSPWPSYGLELGLDDVASKQILGTVVEEASFDCEAGDFLGATWSVFAKKEQKLALGSQADLSALDYIHSGDVTTQTIGGNPVKFEKFSITVRNNFPEGYKFGDRSPQEVDVGPLEVTGEFSVRFLSDAHLDDFLSSNENSIVLKFEGPIADGTDRYYLQFELPRVVYDTGDVNLNQQERLVQNVSFTALEHPTNGLVKVTLQNLQASY